MKSLFICALILSSGTAFARGGTGAANAEYKNVKSLKGLCSDDSKDEEYYKQGYCLSLSEQFKNNECTKKALEELRIRVLADDKDPKFKALKKNEDDDPQIAPSFQCMDKSGKHDIKEAAKSPEKFSYLMIQWMAMVVAQTSDWNVLDGEQKGPKGPNGLLGLSLEKGGLQDMDNKDYACGCKDQVATTSGQSKSDVDVEGQSPGPLDGHHSLTCGSYMMLKQILKDGQMAGGKPKATGTAKGPKKDERSGGARIVAALENHTGDDGIDPQSEWRSQKMSTFCQKFWASPQPKGTLLKDESGTNSDQ